MSAYTTLRITRGTALAKLLESLFGEASNEQLEAFMDAKLKPRLLNARIVADGEENDDGEVD